MKTFIIRLKENEHSCKMAKDCFNQAIQFGVNDIQNFDAINGFDSDAYYAKYKIKPKTKLKKGRKGVIGCFLSHYTLWLKCISDNVPYLILEHDGYLIRPLPKNILDNFDDVLKLDRLDPFSDQYNSILEKEKNEPITYSKYYNKQAKNPAKIGTGNYFRGAWSYIIKPQACKKLVTHIRENGHVTADQQIGDLIVDTKTTIPTIARLHPFYAVGSNIKTASLTGNEDLLL